jgi:hypothetical protein
MHCVGGALVAPRGEASSPPTLQKWVKAKAIGIIHPTVMAILRRRSAGSFLVFVSFVCFVGNLLNRYGLTARSAVSLVLLSAF